ncbi:GNAT family protein [Veronia nyctiphanis]|uniref:GNAT family N-acetyltransferase n=1 Tax=Veronia nyctiphanis TaxID=1278244 RepID=UPI001375ED84
MKQEIAKREVSTLRITSEPNAEGFYRKMGAVTVGEFQSKPAGRVLPMMELELNE